MKSIVFVGRLAVSAKSRSLELFRSSGGGAGVCPLGGPDKGPGIIVIYVCIYIYMWCIVRCYSNIHDEVYRTGGLIGANKG